MDFINFIDKVIYTFLFSNNSPALTVFLLIVTYIASATVILAVTLIYYFVSKDKRKSKYLIVDLLGVFFFNTILKLIVARPRPEGIRFIDEIGYSFPSAHAMVSVAFYGFILYLLLHRIKSIKGKVGITILFSLLIIGIAISRIYLGVHFATDVIAGILFGIIYLVLYIKLIYKKDIFKFHS